jgi:hypothetical protein
VSANDHSGLTQIRPTTPNQFSLLDRTLPSPPPAGCSIFRGDTNVPAMNEIPSLQWTRITGSGTHSGTNPHGDSRDMVLDALDGTGQLLEASAGGIARRTSPLDATGDWKG